MTGPFSIALKLYVVPWRELDAALLVMIDTDTSVSCGSAKHFATRDSGLLLLSLFRWLSIQISAVK